MQNLKQILNLLNGNRLVKFNLSIIFFIGIFYGQNLFSQQSNKPGEEVNIGNIREELYITTDRDIYTTGEQVWLKINKLNRLNHAPWNISKVIYIEMLDKNNFPLKQIKIDADGNAGSTVFVLPDNISSGNYLIRAYTNWMKNWPAGYYSYKTISVINPFEKIEQLNFSQINKAVDSINNRSQFLNSPENSNKTPEKSGPNNNREQIYFSIKSQKPDYSIRDHVKIVITSTDMEGNPVESNLLLSVVKTDLVNSSAKPTFKITGNSNDLSGTIIKPEFLPELEGHLLRGYMRSKVTGEAMKRTDISLSFVGKTARCQFGKTDENGEFYFIIKETGLSEIVIQPLIPVIDGYFVELNQPFSSKFIQDRPESFILDSGRIDGINNAIVSMQINNIYQPFRQKMDEPAKNDTKDFFGKPENSIRMSDFIELTSLREVVKEIIPNVYTLKQNGEYDFKLINKFRGQPFENKPLLLVDGVPMYNVEKVLNIASRDIERADITNTRYFFSENIFDGIVSFITKKGNLSALEFDNSVFRQVFEGCQDRISFYSPDYSSGLFKENRIPDFRNTLFWEPEINTGKDGIAEIEFYTSDEAVEYTIVVEGMSSDGKTGLSTATLIVK